MKWKNRLAVLGAALLVLVFLVYLGYQVSQNLSDRIVTIDAIEVTVEEKISAEGAFLRAQTPVYDGGSGGWTEYLVSDGEKVAVGETLAVSFGSEGAAAQYRACQDLRDRLAALRYAYENITGGADSRRMEELIWRQTASVNGTLLEGQSALADSGLARLEQLVVSRGASKDDKAQFEEQIAALEGELRTRESALSGSTRAVSAAASGYFLSGCDGYGTLLSAARAGEVTPEELLTRQEPADAQAVGCIVDAFEWYFAAVVPKEQADLLRDRDSVEVYFPELSSLSLKTTLREVRTCEGGQAIVLLHSGVMDQQYLSARRQPVDLVAGSYTGIKVPQEALRQVNGVWGVYVLDGSVSRFKPVTWIYQTESYYLVPCAASADDGLFRYDKIILRARGLADNKVLK